MWVRKALQQDVALLAFLLKARLPLFQPIGLIVFPLSQLEAERGTSTKNRHVLMPSSTDPHHAGLYVDEQGASAFLIFFHIS